jgi:hypothetical protein
VNCFDSPLPARAGGGGAGARNDLRLRLATAWFVLTIATAACGSATPTGSLGGVEPVNSQPDASSPRHTAGNSPRPSSDLVALSPPPLVTQDDLPLNCGGPLTFTADALLGISGAEASDHPAAEALRQLVADSPLPKRPGWRLVVLNDENAQFLLPATRPDGSAFWYAEFLSADSSWQYVRSGQCDITPALEGVEPARWELAPGAQPHSDSRTLSVLVFEQACASGASPEGRIVAAAVIYLVDSVTVIFGTRPLPGPQTCQPGPPAEVSVELHEPLGSRELLDGSVIPPEPRWNGL